MRTILIWALFMTNYRLFAPDFDDGSCLVILPWVEWLVVPLVMVALFFDLRAVVMRYQRLAVWRIERQRYLRMRSWVHTHTDAKGVV